MAHMKAGVMEIIVGYIVTFYSNTYHIARRAKNKLSINPKIGFLAFFRVKLNLPRMKPFLPKNIGLT